ncbi:helix-turn-helix domain-containing protein [Nocardia sp. NBC_01730]|uniref:helix-turn-helix domain-containing protein n=1 Tax=Nocardia sp. NBC_01730 TaxID=2975998 RepID=UPI002E108AE8|nr:helix-turn-helix domain-containing protein [Nocardia sp. NBC_01730]
MSDEDSTTLPRRQLGKYLREARQAANMSLDEVSTLMQWSLSKLQRVEKGQSPQVRTVDVEALCRFLDIDDETATALKGLAMQASVKSWWHSYDDLIPGNFNVYVGLESSAQHLILYRPDIIPGLLQTPDYARVLDRTYFPKDPPEDLDRRAQLRAKRQARINRKTRPVRAEFVLNEAALHYVVGSPAIMAAQLHHLANTPMNVTVRIQPFSAGFPLGIAPGPFVILDFGVDVKNREVAPTVVYIESYAGDMYLERTKDVDRYRQADNVIQQTALDVAPSKSLLRQMAREYQA